MSAERWSMRTLEISLMRSKSKLTTMIISWLKSNSDSMRNLNWALETSWSSAISKESLEPTVSTVLIEQTRFKTCSPETSFTSNLLKCKSYLSPRDRPSSDSLTSSKRSSEKHGPTTQMWSPSFTLVPQLSRLTSQERANELAKEPLTMASTLSNDTTSISSPTGTIRTHLTSSHRRSVGQNLQRRRQGLVGLSIHLSSWLRPLEYSSF